MLPVNGDVIRIIAENSRVGIDYIRSDIMSMMGGKIPGTVKYSPFRMPPIISSFFIQGATQHWPHPFPDLVRQSVTPGPGPLPSVLTHLLTYLVYKMYRRKKVESFTVMCFHLTF
jgi:hypothetical protein